MKPIEKVLITCCATLTALIVALALIGGVRGYSPVPFWDMWDATLDFYNRLQRGEGWQLWWSQHNEHRLVLARLFFWMDLAWFGGQNAFLALLNYVFAALGCALFVRMLWEHLADQSPRATGIALSLWLCAWLFNWAQHENFLWAFQSQFWLAQYVPLAAFYCLHRAHSDPSRRWFWLAAVLGVAALGTMANGVLVLPLLACMALLLRLSGRDVGVLATLAVLGLWMYFKGLDPVPGHGSLTQALRHSPIELLRFLLGYFGGPFLYLLGQGDNLDSPLRLVSDVSGLGLISACLALAWREWRAPQRHSLRVALLCFLLFLGGSALGTAGGRVLMGPEQAFTSRYMTPALLAWAALFVLLAPQLVQRCRHRPLRPVVAVALALCLLLPLQQQARKNHDTTHREHTVAALAMALGVQDEAAIRRVYYAPERAPGIVARAQQADTSVFADPPFAGLRTTLGGNAGALPPTRCHGGLSTRKSVATDPGYERVSGWLVHPDTGAAPASVAIVSNGVVIGQGIGGIRRKDLAGRHGQASARVGFDAYLRTRHNPGSITLVAQGDRLSGCALTLPYPPG